MKIKNLNYTITEIRYMFDTHAHKSVRVYMTGNQFGYIPIGNIDARTVLIDKYGHNFAVNEDMTTEYYYRLYSF